MNYADNFYLLIDIDGGTQPPKAVSSSFATAKQRRS